MQTTNHISRPIYRVYAVTKTAGDKSYWTDIGAAWANRDGKGFSLKLNYLPLNGADIVVREPRQEGDAQ